MQTSTTSPMHAWYASAHPCARTNKGIPMKTGEGKKPAVDPRLACGSFAVHPRFISGTKSALRSWLLTVFSTHICLCKPFLCKLCLGTKTKWRRSTGRQPATKSASRPADKMVINRGSTGDFILPSVYIGFRLFVLLERR